MTNLITFIKDGLYELFAMIIILRTPSAMLIETSKMTHHFSLKRHNQDKIKCEILDDDNLDTSICVCWYIISQ